LAQFQAGADKDPRLRYPCCRFIHKTGLADPGLATNQHNGRCCECRVKGVMEALELIFAADEC
jgi:hypothetical protein